MRDRKLGGKCTEVCALDFKVKSQKICERVEVDIQWFVAEMDSYSHNTRLADLSKYVYGVFGGFGQTASSVMAVFHPWTNPDDKCVLV